MIVTLSEGCVGGERGVMTLGGLYVCATRHLSVGDVHVTCVISDVIIWTQSENV